MADDIDFLQVPNDLRDPGQYTEFDNRNARPGLTIQPHDMLFPGQMLASGTATPLVPVRIFGGDDEAKALFGRGSMLASMWAAGRKVDTSTQRWALPVLDLVAGTQAAGACTFGGTATEAGLGSIMIGGRRVRFAIPLGATADEVALACVGAITADLDVQVTAAVDGVVDEKAVITARHKGEEGNNIDIRFNYYDGERLPAGITVVVTPMSGGTGNPDMTDALAAISAKQFHTIIMPWNDTANRNLLAEDMASRIGPVRKLDGLAYGAMRGSVGALATFGLSRNNNAATTFGEAGMVDTPWERAAAYGTACAYQARIDPASPIQYVELPGQHAPAEADRSDHDDRELLLHDGIAVGAVNEAGKVEIRRAITHYRANLLGFADDSYLDSETMRIIFYIRYDLHAMMAQKFPRSKLGDNGSRGKGVATPDIVRDQILARAVGWAEAGLIEDLESFRKNLLVQRSTTDTERLNARIPANVINGFRIFGGQIQFIL
ncbi:MAG: phage tail protein [Rhizobiales bacterium]|nr:phage tail protein [Hyphomicrobiales bacterium]